MEECRHRFHQGTICCAWTSSSPIAVGAAAGRPWRSWPRSWAEPTVGDRHDDQDHQEQRQVVTRVATLSISRSTSNGIGRAPTGELVLLSAVAAFAVPAALGVAEALPAVESESASPGLGHRGLLAHRPYRLDEATLYRRPGRRGARASNTSTSDATSGTGSMPAFCSVVSVLVSFVVRSFSTNSSGALRAAASGRPRPPKTRRREPASTRPWPASASRSARRALETCTKTRTSRSPLLGRRASTRPVRCRGPEKGSFGHRAHTASLREPFFSLTLDSGRPACSQVQHSPPVRRRRAHDRAAEEASRLRSRPRYCSILLINYP